jgi:hypothetical protein
MKKTEWFPADVKPYWVGVYDATYMKLSGEIFTGYALWTGIHWGTSRPTVEAAERSWQPSEFQKKTWRGLAEQPK